MRTKLSFLFLLVVFSVTAQTALMLDTSYGNNGISVNSTISGRNPYRLLFEDNKYFVVFYGNGGIFSKNYDGSDNLGFGSNGNVYFHNPNETLSIKGAKSKNGFLYVFGNIKNDALSLSHGFIIKVSTAGILDSSFGVNGRASFNLVGYQTINDIEITDSGSIFTTGSIRNPTAKMYLAKFTPAGILDTSFDPSGYKTYIYAVNATSDGIGLHFRTTDFLIAGTHILSTSRDLCVINVSLDGTLNTAYGYNGWKMTSHENLPIDGYRVLLRAQFTPDNGVLFHYLSCMGLSGCFDSLIKYDLTTNTRYSYLALPSLYQDYFVDANSNVYYTGSNDCDNASCQRKFLVKRKNSAGTIDLNFLYQFPSSNPSEDLSACFYFHQDGKIAVAGYGIDNGLEMLRVVEAPLNTSEFSKNKFSVSPNPAQNVININTVDNVAISGIAVFDIYGKRVLENEGDTRTISIENLASGIYFLTINSEDSVTVLKFIKK